MTKLTNDQKRQIIEAVNLHKAAKDWGNAQLSRETGINEGTISQMLSGKTDGTDRNWLLLKKVANPEGIEGLFQTKDFESVLRVCNMAIQHKMMLGLTGNTGMGKSTALTAFSKRKNVHYYYVDRTLTPRVFLKDLLRKMGVPYDGSLNDMLNQAAEELNTQIDPLVILDECGKLSDKMIGIIHSLRDKTIFNCGFVLAGMPDFQNMLIKLKNKGVTGYGEFYRRINDWHHLSGLTSEEIVFVLNKHGITGKEDQREYRRLTQFGDLMNAINKYKLNSL